MEHLKETVDTKPIEFNMLSKKKTENLDTFQVSYSSLKL